MIEKQLKSPLRSPLLRAILAGGGGTPQPLRFAIPNNYLPDINPALSSATETNVRCRMPFRIGSTNLSELVFSFNGWHSSGTVKNYANAYSIVKLAIEKSGQTASYPVTFSGGRTKTINPGDIDIQSDALLPSTFGLGSFTRGDLYYIRMEIGVASGGVDYLPTGPLAYTRYEGGFPSCVGLRINPATFVGAAVDSYGTLTFTSGYSAFTGPYLPMILGRSAGGAFKSVMSIGDSIVGGQPDATPTTGLMGGFARAMCDTDGVSNPVAGAIFGISGSNSNLWNGDTRLTSYLKYATHVIEEYGTNSFASAPGADPAAALASCQVIWTAAQAVGAHVSRVKMIPRTTGNTTTPLNSAWASGGNARAFNALLDTAGAPVIPRNSLRVGATEGTDAFYQWASGTYTADYIHPNTTGAIVDAADIRAGIAALP